MTRFAIAVAIVTAPGLALAQAADGQPPANQQQPAPDAPPPAPPGDRPPPQYYVEPPPAAGQPRPQQPAGPAPAQPGYAPGTYEPPPPGYGYAPALVYEPPPPPKPRHVAPKYSFWLGARGGWFIPFGNLWARGTDTGQFVEFDGVSWSEYASSGPMFELDIGARLGRNYNLFLLWEHAALGSGSTDAFGEQDGGDTDFYALGLRVSSDPDRVGFLTEIAIGARRFRATWSDGTELQLTEAPFEARLGLGADIRLNPAFSLSPLVTVGVGSFGSAEFVAPNGTRSDATTPLDERAGHGWITLQLGGHFDIGGGG